MNSRATWRIFLTAVGLFLFIMLFERRQLDSEDRAKKREKIFPTLDSTTVNLIEVRLTNQVIRAERTNGVWRLLTPPYPAQSTPIETLLTEFAKAERRDMISPSQLTANKEKLSNFGLEPPLASIVVTQGTNRFHLQIGKRQPLSDEEIYAQPAGSPEVIVTSSTLAKLIPASANEWRSPMLLNLSDRVFDHLQIRSGQRLLEFQRDPAAQIWRISKPVAARANNERINELLKTLTTARVSEFVTDSPAADLERYGLQAPEIELAFLLGTNRVTGLEFGGSPTNDLTNVFARRLATTNVVLTPRAVTEPLLLPYKAYHDQYLLSTPATNIAQINVQFAQGGFALERQTNGLWQITQPAPMPTDQELAKYFITNLLRMEIVDFAKDVPDDADLKQFGLDAPVYSAALFTARTNGVGGFTNALATQVSFGKFLENASIYARRSDEIPVYFAQYGEVLRLPRQSWQLRDRRVFDFAATNVVALTLSLGGQTNRMTRDPNVGWSADPIRNAALEEAIFRLGMLTAMAWVDKGAQSMANRGFTTDGLAIAMEVARDGATNNAALVFGRATARGRLAATVLPGETVPTIFEFPGTLYDDLAQALGLPK